MNEVIHVTWNHPWGDQIQYVLVNGKLVYREEPADLPHGAASRVSALVDSLAGALGVEAKVVRLGPDDLPHNADEDAFYRVMLLKARV